MTKSRRNDYGWSRWAIAHPYWVPVVSALMIAGWSNLITHDRVESIVIGIAILVVQFLCWRPSGPLHRYTMNWLDKHDNEE